jgi:putative phosphoribosyl transferase
MVFASREDAGRKLGQFLHNRNVGADLVVGLPRGGVVVAAAVARVLELPVDALVVRKIGHPSHREFAVGALAEGDVVLLDQEVIQRLVRARSDLEHVITEEKRRLEDYLERFHPNGPLAVSGKAVLLVDDGLATGATAEAGVISLKKKGARRVVVAVPVASTSSVHRLGNVADEVIALLEDPEFDAVGRYYLSFAQTGDDEVMKLLGSV